MEYIEIPNFYFDDIVCSPILNKFIKDSNYVEKNKISLDSLRKEYKKNKDIFFQLVHELRIRGFIFHDKSNSKILSSIVKDKSDSKKILYTERSEEKYKLLNRNIFKELNFKDINNDLYFNCIPIYAFKKILNEYNEEIIIAEFKKYGFEVLDIDRFIYRKNEEAANSKNTNKDKKYEEKENVTSNNNRNSDYSFEIIKEKMLDYIKIEEVVPAEIKPYRSILEYCNGRGIYNLGQLRELDLQELTKLPNVGTNIILEIEDAIKIRMAYIELINYLRELDGEKYLVTENEIITKEDILNVLKLENIIPNKHMVYIKIKKYFKENQYITISDLDNFDYSELYQIKSVGTGCIEEIKEIVKLNKKAINYFLNNNIMKEKSDSKIGNNEDIELELLNLIKIDDLLREDIPTYIRIKEFLYKEGVFTLLDIIHYDLEKIMNIGGVGEKRFEEINNIVIKEINNIKELNNKFQTGEFKIDKEIYNQIKDLSISEVMHELEIKLENKINNKYSNMKIEELQNKLYTDIEDLESAINLLYLNKKLNVSLNIDRIISRSILDNISKRDKKIIDLRLNKKLTLEETGEFFDLTRERVRQIESEYIKKINTNFRNNKLLDTLKLIYHEENYFRLNEFKEKMGTSNYLLIKLIKENKIDGLYYVPYFKTVYFENKSRSEEIINNLIKDLPKYGLVEDYIFPINEVITREYNINDSNEIKKVYENNNIYLSDLYYYKKSIYKGDQLEIILKYIHKKPLRIDKSGVHIIEKYIQENLGIYEERSNDRSWAGIADRSESILLVGPKTYIHEDNTHVSIKTINLIKEIIDEEIVGKEFVSIEKIYYELQEREPNSYLISKHHCYSLIQKYHTKDYKTGHGNTMRVLREDRDSLENDEIVYNYCKENNSIVFIDEIINEVGLTRNKIDLAVERNSEMCKVGAGRVCIVNDVINEKAQEKINRIILEEIEKGYSSSSNIMTRFIFEPSLNNIITELDIVDPKELTGIIKHISPKVKGAMVFLYDEETEIRSIKDVIIKEFPVELYREDLVNLLEELEYYDGNAYHILNTLLNERHYIQVEESKFIKYEEFKIKENLEIGIVNFAEKVIEEKGYFIPRNFLNYIRSNFDIRKYNINQHLIASILVENGYKKLERLGMSYNVEIIILVKESSKYSGIEELVYQILKEETIHMHEISVYDHLAKLGIYKKEDYNNRKKLMRDIKANNLIEVDLLGNVHLGGK